MISYKMTVSKRNYRYTRKTNKRKKSKKRSYKKRSYKKRSYKKSRNLRGGMEATAEGRRQQLAAAATPIVVEAEAVGATPPIVVDAEAVGPFSSQPSVLADNSGALEHAFSDLPREPHWQPEAAAAMSEELIQGSSITLSPPFAEESPPEDDCGWIPLLGAPGIQRPPVAGNIARDGARRRRSKQRCKKCGEIGHNKATCKNPERPRPPARAARLDAPPPDPSLPHNWKCSKCGGTWRAELEEKKKQRCAATDESDQKTCTYWSTPGPNAKRGAQQGYVSDHLEMIKGKWVTPMERARKKEAQKRTEPRPSCLWCENTSTYKYGRYCSNKCMKDARKARPDDEQNKNWGKKRKTENLSDFAEEDTEPSECRGCKKNVVEEGIACNRCGEWWHWDCTPLSYEERVEFNTKSTKAWYCDDCTEFRRGKR